MLNARFPRLRAATVVEAVCVLTDPPPIAERASSIIVSWRDADLGPPETSCAAAAVARRS